MRADPATGADEHRMFPDTGFMSHTADLDDLSLDRKPTWRHRLRAVWNALVGAIGLLVGLLPHVLHHVTLLAGTALVAGSGGTALFGALGLLASVPFLLRLHRRFGTWRAPAIGLLVGAALFSLSTFVIGPANRGASGASDGVGTSDGGGTKPGPTPSVDHTGHHT